MLKMMCVLFVYSSIDVYVVLCVFVLGCSIWMYVLLMCCVCDGFDMCCVSVLMMCRVDM